MQLKKRFKLRWYAVGLLVFSSVTIIASACGNFAVLDAQGSSSVQPFLEKMAVAYSQSHNVEINVQGGGSGVGINGIADGSTLIGTASKSPMDTIIKNKKVASWKKRKIKTITIAKDAIGLIFVPPANYQGTDFAISQENILDLYDAFAGVKDIALKKFYTGNNIPPDQNIVLKGYARSGGSGASGTAEAFLKDSGFDTGKINANVKEILSTGKYQVGKTVETSESNAEAYTFFKTQAKNRPGSIIYLGLGYILNNISIIRADGFALMSYINKTTNQQVAPEIKTVANQTYRWVRPFNIMISLNSEKISPIQRFIKWILFSNYDDLVNEQAVSQIKKIYESQGLIELSDAEKKQMFLLDQKVNNLDFKKIVKMHFNNFWTADYDFENSPRFGVKF